VTKKLTNESIIPICAALLSFVSCSGDHAKAKTAERLDCAADIETASGIYWGEQNSSDTCQYLGIRYAQAPLGDLRF
jgi:hypothetical protein